MPCQIAFKQKNEGSNAFDDVASTIHQSLPPLPLFFVCAHFLATVRVSPRSASSTFSRLTASWRVYGMAQS
jgi:hypothetical protein